jgi:YggT family protein
MAAIYYLIDTVFSFAVYAFLLRVLLPLVRADVRNPLTQAILSMTNWLVMPLRRLLPPIRRADTASIVALALVQVAATLVLFKLRTGALLPFVPLAVEALRSLVRAALLLYTVLIIVYALLSFIAQGVRSPVTALLASLCEPVLAPLRRLLPIVGGIDFSPLVAIVGLTALRILIG